MREANSSVETPAHSRRLLRFSPSLTALAVRCRANDSLVRFCAVLNPTRELRFDEYLANFSAGGDRGPAALRLTALG